MKRLTLLILTIVGNASMYGATLITAGDFSNPSLVTFGTSGTFVNPALYTENGASFRATLTGGTLYVYSGVMDPALASSTKSIDVIFGSQVNRFGFLASTLQSNSRDFQVDSVLFFSDTAMSNQTESYNTVAAMSIGSFFGLEGASGFSAVRITMTPTSFSGFSPLIDDFRFEATAANGVPEPSSLAMVGVGAGFLAMAWRRRRASGIR